MPYKTGEKVKIVGFDKITDPSSWNSKGMMDTWVGTEMTVRDSIIQGDTKCFMMEEDNGRWIWTKEMIERRVVEYTFIPDQDLNDLYEVKEIEESEELFAVKVPWMGSQYTFLYPERNGYDLTKEGLVWGFTKEELLQMEKNGVPLFSLERYLIKPESERTDFIG